MPRPPLPPSPAALSPAHHAAFQALLESHLLGEIGPEERLELFEHLEHCEQCRAVLEAEERLSTNLAALPKLKPPPDLRAGILRELKREREELSRTVLDEVHWREHLRTALRPGQLEELEEAEDEVAQGEGAPMGGKVESAASSAESAAASTAQTAQTTPGLSAQARRRQQARRRRRNRRLAIGFMIAAWVAAWANESLDQIPGSRHVREAVKSLLE